MTINRYSDGRIYKVSARSDLHESATEKSSKDKDRKHKYGAQASVYDNIKFDSKLEMKCYIALKQMKRANLIKDFKLQVPYELQEKYVNVNGKKIRAINYVSDFVIENNNGYIFIVDCKGMVLQYFKLKKKLFEYKYKEILYIVKSVSELHKLIIGGE